MPCTCPTLSTAAAAEGLERGPQPYDAAVCAPAAARLHGLEVLADGIGDMQAAVTRFVLVARPGVLPEPTGADKTTVVLFQRDDHAGGLLALLEQFAARGINMTRLESRPTKESMGSYCFSIDLEGHVLDERVGEALMGLRRICAEVRFLGSYPRADRQRASIAPLTSDDRLHRRPRLARGDPLRPVLAAWMRCAVPRSILRSRPSHHCSPSPQCRAR